VPPVEIGVVLPLYQTGPERVTTSWTQMRALAERAEELGFDTIWTIDELLWLYKDKPPMGVWDGVSVTGAVAAVTSRAKIGTWVLSALHRNAGIIAKTAETIDEISGGRFVFGIGAGHAYPGQAHAFGLPEDKIVGRFEDALQIIVPLVRKGRADFQGTYHSANDLTQLPQGPRPGAIPLFIGGNGPRVQRLAIRHGDIWSSYIESSVDEAAPRMASFLAICAEEGRDPASIGKSIGMSANPLLAHGEKPDTLSGSAEEMAATLRTFVDGGYTQVELMFEPPTIEALDALAPLIELLRGPVSAAAA
jgi:alkanesulfonate monooxygenase SsuD/methylene tetrahydromethanopterin reductase-like flavin-dependent oxidoreductase (luciferase family)